MKKILLLAFIITRSLPSMSQQEIGLQLYSLRNEFKNDVPGTLDKIKNMGIHEIEGGSSYGLAPETFKKLLSERNLVTVGVGAEFDQLSNDPMEAAKTAKFYGAKYVICYWIPHKETFTLADADRAIEVFNNAGKILAEQGLAFCYHMHGFEFGPFENGTLFDHIAAKTDSKFVNFEMDVFWVKHPGQDPVSFLNKYKRRFPLMHLKDRLTGTPGNQLGTADDDSNVVLGTGDVGIAAIMKAAKKTGVKHYFIEDESSHSETQIPISIDYLKKLK